MKMVLGHFNQHRCIMAEDFQIGELITEIDRHSHSCSQLSCSEQWSFACLGSNLEREALPNDLLQPLESSQPPFPLSKATVSDRLHVQTLDGNDQMLRHLRSMGIVPGVQIQVLDRSISGSVIVIIRGQRLGLGARIAQHIWVTAQSATL